MKKNGINNYAIEAFKLYAKLGKPDYNNAYNLIHNSRKKDIENSKIYCNKMDDARYIPILLDIMAVDKTIEMFNDNNKNYIADAIENIYFYNYNNKGELTARIRRYSVNNYVDERTVYRWLEEGITMFAYLRGLRTDYNDVSAN